MAQKGRPRHSLRRIATGSSSSTVFLERIVKTLSRVLAVIRARVIVTAQIVMVSTTPT